MIYIIASEGVPDLERRRLLENAKLSLEETQAINNLGIIGCKLSSGGNSKKDMGRYTYWGSHALDMKRNKAGKETYDLSRYVPMIKRVMEDQVQNELPKTSFPWIQEPAVETSTPTSTVPRIFNRSNKDSLVPTDGSRPFSLRTTRPRWIKKSGGGGELESPTRVESKGSAIKSGPPIIIFVLGGMSFSEMRAAYEVSKDCNRDVIIGIVFFY
jgi:syntaxin-binding protein 1